MSYARLKNTAFVYAEEFTLAIGEQMRQNDIALADAIVGLGGSRSKGIPGNGRQDAIDYLNLPIDGVIQAGFSYYVYVEVMTTDAGTTVQPVLRDITNGVDLWTGAASGSLVWAEQISGALVFPAAERRYRLQVIKSNANADVLAIGFLRRRG